MRIRYISSILVGMFIIMLANQLSWAASGDADISDWVKIALTEDPRIHVTDVDVTTHDGIVTLSGMVRNLAEKKYAYMEAAKINGVKGIIDRLDLEESDLTDSEILDAVSTRLSNSMGVSDEQIVTTVANGEVRLHGVVHSYAEQEQAELLASEVFGVNKVKNELNIQYVDQRTDSQIKSDVEGMLERDVYLTGLPVTVSVNGGQVALDGEVGSYYQKLRAGHDVYFIWNVKGLDNRIEVKNWADQDVRTSPAQPTDMALKTEVRDELDQDLRLHDPYRIAVVSLDGDIILEGSVMSRFQKRLAGQDAMDVLGVRSVRNQLEVEGASADTSQMIKEIREMVQTDDELRNQDIRVYAGKGAIFLAGTVETTYQKLHAEDLAWQVRGVRRVVNDLKVNWLLNYSDQMLEQRIRERLEANAETHLESDAIQIDVNDGIAVLSGTMHFLSEKQEAGHLAEMTPGISGVENDLLIHGLKLNENSNFKKDESKLRLP